MPFAKGERKKSTHFPLGNTNLFVNRRLAAGRLEIDFKKPFDFLAKLPAEARGEAPSEATNSIWWCLLDEIRTFFEQNPDAD